MGTGKMALLAGKLDASDEVEGDGSGSDDDKQDKKIALSGKAALMGTGKMALLASENDDDKAGQEGVLSGKAALIGAVADVPDVESGSQLLLQMADPGSSGLVPASYVHAMGRGIHGE